jgi:hypothetical protein
MLAALSACPAPHQTALLPAGGVLRRRIAMELVETKLLWAEAQEQLVKLKRSLVKAQVGGVGWQAVAGLQRRRVGVVS